jgi:hypothetical protein
MPIKKTIQEVAEVAVVNGAVLSVTTFSNLEIALKLLLLIVSIAYTVDKWWFNRKRRK